LIFVFFTGSVCSFGQTSEQTLYWVRYQLVFRLSPKLSWYNDIDNRRFINPDVQNQFIFHSRVHRKSGPWDLAAGLTYSVAYASKPEIGYRHSISEIRPVVEANYEIPLGRASLAQRIRVDNRVFQEESGVSLFEESFYVMRLRYRMQLRFPIRRNDAGTTTIGLRVADEVMINTSRNFYDQNRVYVTADFYLTPRLTLETGYIYIDQQRLGTEEFFSRHVMRLSLLHNINLAD
jgi:hypothetical protein